jgi:hypothetical protein
LGSE